MGIAFLNSCPVADGLDYLRLDRLPRAAKWSVVPTCHQPLMVTTHWIGNRTLPHLDEDCPGCADERAKRFEAYVSVLRMPGAKHQIVALTLAGLQQVYQTMDRSESIRGRRMVFARRTERVNGPIEVTVLDESTPEVLLPPAPDLFQHLIHIWGLDTAHIGQDHPDYAATIRAIAKGKELPGQLHIRDGREAV